MMCQCGHEYLIVGEETKAVKCYYEIHNSLRKMFPDQDKPTYQPTGRPPGWHFMKQFVDKDGNVFHKGKEMKKLQGTLPATVITKKKKKRRTQEEILLARYKKKKAAIKKASTK